MVEVGGGGLKSGELIVILSRLYTVKGHFHCP